LFSIKITQFEERVHSNLELKG